MKREAPIKARVVGILLIGLALIGGSGCRIWQESNKAPPAFDSHRFDANPWERDQ